MKFLSHKKNNSNNSVLTWYKSILNRPKNMVFLVVKFPLRNWLISSLYDDDDWRNLYKKCWNRNFWHFTAFCNHNWYSYNKSILRFMKISHLIFHLKFHINSSAVQCEWINVVKTWNPPAHRNLQFTQKKINIWQTFAGFRWRREKS